MADRYAEPLTPRRLLALWRERWGKQPDAEETPYFPGALAAWGRKLAHVGPWGWPGVAAGCVLFCVLFFALVVSVRPSLNAQVMFFMPLLVIALVATRYGGTVVTLTIVGLALIASTRYLSWRLLDTLEPELNLEFALGFLLWVAEAYWFISTLVGKMRTIWRLRRDYVALPAEQFEWPTVDVFLWCGGQAPAALRAAAAIDWPMKKLKLHFLDDREREEVKEWAGSIGAFYLAQPDPAAGKAGTLNAASALGKGELIAVLDCDKMPGKSFLTRCAGWFVFEKRFAMLLTHDHFLAPPASAKIEQIVEAPHEYQAFALIRRSMLEQIGGVDAATPTAAAHTALRLQALGYGVAYAGVSIEAEDARTLALEPRAKPVSEVFRIDFPFGRTVLWKERIASLHRALNFYAPVSRMIFLLAPALGLLGDARLIQASFTLFAAYAVPHLLHVHISQARMRGHGRLTLMAEMRETALGWYMLALTGVNLVPVMVGRIIASIKDESGGEREPFDWMIAAPYLIAFALNLAGIAAGVVRLFEGAYSRPDFASMFLLWCLYNLLLLGAMLAVVEEARHIRVQTRVKRRLPAMVKLASRRTVSCVTRNFPEPVLLLELKSPLAPGDEDAVHVSIFNGYREYDFPAQLVSWQDGGMTVKIDQSVLPEYRALAAAIFARGADWPEWLPPRGADHPIPQWISKPLMAAFIYTLDQTGKAASLLHFPRLTGWLQKRKKT